MAHKTWQELKDFCNTLDEKFLNQTVFWWGDERGGIIETLSPLNEDFILTDEGYEPSSSFSDQEEIDAYGYSILPKGTPIIFVD